MEEVRRSDRQSEEEEEEEEEGEGEGKMSRNEKGRHKIFANDCTGSRPCNGTRLHRFTE